MDDDTQHQILQESRANRLASVRRRLLRAWLDLATFDGLTGVADEVEETVDVVDRAWKVAVREAGREPQEDRLRDAIEVGA